MLCIEIFHLLPRPQKYDIYAFLFHAPVMEIAFLKFDIPVSKKSFCNPTALAGET